ncbi:MAG: DUF1127 domain-containing protein [Shimia sp.]|uniref:DUF1127 domain-containing protein n=1 Tax=Shimia sp. TaxID=1954381 RepID=UPI0019E24DA7|nr:DUF1127 domain-containing protein [Shimia sp.]MBE1292099.1 DUF1127 domain-containing protein [Paracoccaceae bacterium]MBO6897720.1 DUF1127 domain-containing protein [Shimia sp.]
MAYVASTPSVSAPKASGLSVVFAKAAERFRQYRVMRTTYNELNQLSDRELNDLGLSRSMIRRVAIEASREA